MERRKFFTMMAASAAAMATGALADWRDHDGHWHHDDHHGGWHGDDHHGYHDDWRGRENWHWRDDRGGWHGDRDRYWHDRYGDWGRRHYVGHDRIWFSLRRHNYYRWEGDPYWYHGRYVVRTYDRWGNPIFVEMDPYSGDFIGVIRF